MDRTPVTSSNVASVGYENGVLEVEFNHGGIYQYQGVPPEAYQGLVSAASVGGYLAKHIKGAYPYAQVPDMPSAPESEAPAVNDDEAAAALADVF